MPWNLVRRNHDVPAPAGAHQIQRFNDNERVADVYKEGAGQVAEVQITAVKTYAANEAWARVVQHGITRGNRLLADAKQDADSYSHDPHLREMAIELTEDGLREYAEGRSQILAAGRARIAEEVARPVSPPLREKKGFFARLFGG